MSRAYKIANIEKVLKNIEKAGSDVQDVVSAIVEETALFVLDGAVDKVRIDNKLLQQSLYQEEGEDRFTRYVGADLGLAPYAPYHEFGTGDLVDIPPGLESIAIVFKGKGIRKVNISPQPYLYPSLVEGRTFMREEFLKEYDAIVKK